MLRPIIGFLYKNILRKLLFSLDPEYVHDHFVAFGYFASKFPFLLGVLDLAFNYKNPALKKTVMGIVFDNPVGLSAGFDYDGYLTKTLPHVGFGFSTVGTITNIAYEGNTKPRLVRLIKSKALLVNKGFKSQGVDAVLKRLEDPKLKDVTFGVSVGSSNVPEINTTDKAIEDYLATFTKLEKSPYIKFYELNISCPNTNLADGFAKPEFFEKLASRVAELKLSRPIFVKMPSEASFEQTEQVIEIAFKYGLYAFIFSNLVKDRNNKWLMPEDKQKIETLKGNLSGMPVKEHSLNLIRHFKQKYGSKIVIVGTGGIFEPQDAQEKIEAGADLVQLITGMIFEGPTLIGNINKHLVQKLKYPVTSV